MRKSETYRNEIKSYIVRTGMTMTEVVDYLSDEYGWGPRAPPPSRKKSPSVGAGRRKGCGSSGGIVPGTSRSGHPAGWKSSFPEPVK